MTGSVLIRTGHWSHYWICCYATGRSSSKTHRLAFEATPGAPEENRKENGWILLDQQEYSDHLHIAHVISVAARSIITGWPSKRSGSFRATFEATTPSRATETFAIR